ncbi:FAD-linked oxidoreductase-like protein [Lactifluus subvellereus]|nr:FAD-linked oxidoreductase-like protein [Lactifluus subvellereus]
MLAQSFKRQALTRQFHLGRGRCYRGLERSATHSSRGSRVPAAGGGALTASLMLGFGYSLYADAPSPSGERAPTPLPKLITSYVVYSMCSIPGLVDASPLCLLSLTEAVVRATFFTQFVGGDTAHACLPSTGGAGFTDGPVHKHAVREMIHSIDVAADFEDSQIRVNGIPGSGRRTWVAVKLVRSLILNRLLHLSTHLSSLRKYDRILFPGCPRTDDLAVLKMNEPPPGSPLSAQDLIDLRELHENLIRICTRARARDIRLIVDAEYSWYQPAIDSISLSLMRKFNKDPSPPLCWLPRPFTRSAKPGSPPLVYVTFQAYLRRTPEYLTQSLQDAASHQYALGIKLVRGAYHEQEAKPDSPSLPLTTNASWPPVFTNKVDTDRCYDTAAAELVRAIANVDGRGPTVGALFGSHNSESCAKVIDALVDVGLAFRGKDGTVQLDDLTAERVSLAQLYGMSDTLTDRLADLVKTRAPFVIKYVPYGPLSEVLPYLSRRAIENKSILGSGHAAEERKQAFDAIWQHFFGK